MSDQIDYSEFILKAAEKYRQAGMFNRYGILKDAADQFKFMVEQIDKLNTEMPCGHLARYAVNGEDGTQYCSLCRSKSLETCDLEVRRHLEIMAVLYHQSNAHKYNFSNCNHPHCETSRN